MDLYTECLASIEDAAAAFQRQQEETLLAEMREDTRYSPLFRYYLQRIGDEERIHRG